MKSIIYAFIARSAAVVIGINTMIGNAITSVIAGGFNLASFVVASITAAILKTLDLKRYQHAALMLDQYSDLSELQLLININRVRDDALKQRAWTMMHTISINRLGTALHTQCGWPTARIHSYLKPVIESIPGMVYQAGDNYEESSD